jgi:hypothetical protein
MSNWHDSDEGFKRFSESHRKPKGGFMVRLGWHTLDTFGVKIASVLGKRKENKRRKIKEARQKAHR